MNSITTNAPRLLKKWQQRRAALDRAKHRALRNAAIMIDRAQVDNLSGPAIKAKPKPRNHPDAGRYPVPVRTGNLRNSTFFDAQRSDFAIVGNKAKYAMVIHQERPFLDDAAESVDAVEMMAIAIRKEVLGL